MPMGATDPCKIGVVGSTPIRSTEGKDESPTPPGSIVKRKSRLASNEVFRVRILVGLLYRFAHVLGATIMCAPQARRMGFDSTRRRHHFPGALERSRNSKQAASSEFRTSK